MKDDEYEQLRVKRELQELRHDREDEKKSKWVGWFLAIWLLPLPGMLVVQGDDLPKTAGPDLCQRAVKTSHQWANQTQPF